MIYCVIKGTTIIIDGSENPAEIMKQNATQAGYTESSIELLTEDEYFTRKFAEPLPAKQKIIALKEKLAETDYAVIKIAEGVATVEEYADVIAQRQAWRDEINCLENSVD